MITLTSQTSSTNRKCRLSIIWQGDHLFGVMPIHKKSCSMDYFLDYRKGLEILLANDIRYISIMAIRSIPHAGGLQVSELLSWKGKNAFSREQTKDYILNGVKAGTYKQYSNVFFATLYDAGHRVQYGQPQWVFDFLKIRVLKKNIEM